MFRRFAIPAVVAVGVLGVAGCPSSSPAPGPAVIDAGALDAAVTVVTPPDLGLEFLAVHPDGGTSALVFDTTGTRPMVEPVDELQITTRVALRNYRIRLFDEADRAMISDDESQETTDGLRYRMRFPTSLKTGYRYTVVVDPQNLPSITDATGQELPEQRLEFQIAGEKAKRVPPPKTKPSRKRSGRH